jgi:hypothetical protein
VKLEIVERGKGAFEVDLKGIEPRDPDKFYLEVWIEGEFAKVCLDRAFMGKFRRVDVTAEV